MHALDHMFEDDDTISCELCDITSQSVQLDWYTGDTSYDNGHIVNNPSSIVVDCFFNSPIAKIVSPTSVYNKPPPVL
ncbi:hypothetical protein GCM10022393_31390 [Aquimarina addita]|uniref:Ig-like domain-containing protein n=2 Tax=Aquimarina addita TaxID=870485 RepID=A0ABP6UNN8_9FLAO